MATIIGICGISGAGTTTTTKALAQVFKATALYWDDFDEISKGPDDYVAWFHKSGDYADWQYPSLVQTLKELKSGHTLKHPVTGKILVATPYVFFDSPLGRMHTATAQFVDLMIHLDTSMDVALCRRLVRDYQPKTDATATDIKKAADMAIDGNRSIEDIINHIMKTLENRHAQEHQNMINIRELHHNDIDTLVDSFANHNWEKPKSLFESYVMEQQDGKRQAWVAFVGQEIAGYVTLSWHSHYQPFATHNIPEIMDLNVLPPFRCRGVGTSLLAAAEEAAREKSSIIGLGVGLYDGYGDAQKLYVKRGYIPDGNGPTYNYVPLSYGQSIMVDDDLVLWFTKTFIGNTIARGM